MTSTCPQGHPLQMRVMQTTWKCDACFQTFYSGQPSFGCSIDNYDRCASCNQQQQAQPHLRAPDAPVPTSSPPAFRPEASKCPQGHGLTKSNFDASQRWKCDRCGSVLLGGASYSCRVDNYDQCPTCTLLPASSTTTAAVDQQKASPPPPSSGAFHSSLTESTADFITTCDKGHDLVLSQMPPTQNWQCDFCPKIQKGGTSYADRKCNVDCCSECYQQQTKNQLEKKKRMEEKKKKEQEAAAAAAAALLLQQQQQNKINVAKPTPSIDDQKFASAKCPSGHKLTRSEFASTLEWKCDLCGEMKKGGSAFSCRDDNHDQCYSCTVDGFNVPCWLCHQKLARQDLPNIEWKCDRCSKKFNGGTSYGCRNDDADCCLTCFADLEKKRINALGKIEADQKIQNLKIESAATKKQEQEDLENQNKLHQQINAALSQILSNQQQNTNHSTSTTASCPTCKKSLTKSTLNIEWKCDKCFKMNHGGTAYSCRVDNFDSCETCALSSSSSSSIPSSSPFVSNNYNNTLATSSTSSVGKYRCRALLVGVNYPNTRAELKGCVNDVALIRKVLPIFGFDLNASNCKILVDDPSFPGRTGHPTKQEIMSGVEWLVSGAKPGDNLFLHISSHGCRIDDDDGDEDSGFDVAQCPSDYETAGVIRDDWFFEHLVKPLPAGCNLRVIADLCHSLSLMESEYTFVFTGEQKKFVPYQPKKGKTRGFVTSTRKRADCNCWVISGTKDESTSADISTTKDYEVDLLVGSGPGKAGGACTTSLVEVLARAPRNAEGIPTLSMAELFFQLQESLRRRRFEQQPQLSVTKKFDLMSTPFSFVGPIDGVPVTSQQQQQLVPSMNINIPNNYLSTTSATTISKRKPKFKSLFTGINYSGTSAELKGCHNDVLTWMKMMSDLGFDTSNRRVLVDSYTFPGRTGRPTRAEMEDSMRWLVEGATSDSKLFLQYAGHGTLVDQKNKAAKDRDEDEDSALVPVDYTSRGLIIDDWIFDNVVKPLPAGCTLFIAIDACRSGGAADLEFHWKWEGEEKKFAPVRPAAGRTRGFHTDSSKHAEATVVAISGCKNEQTSSDVSNTSTFRHDFGNNKGSVGTGGGAMTNAMAEALSNAPKGADGRPEISYMELLFRCQENLKRRNFEQVPQLTSSKNLDLNQKFDMANL